MTRFNTPVIIALLAAAHLAGSRAEAMAFRLSLDTSLFHYQRAVNDYSNENVERKESVSSVGFGEGAVLFDQSLIQQQMGFRAGFGVVLIKHLTVGMTLGLNGGRVVFGEERDGDSNKDKLFLMGYEFMPFAAYKFDLGRFHPFVMITLGYDGARLTFDQGNDSRISVHHFGFGGGGGVHYFPAEVVSIDAGLTIKGGVGRTVYREETVSPLTGATTEIKVKTPNRTVRLNLVLGLSWWF